MPSDLTREDFRRWGRDGGLAGRKTPRQTCPRCGSFVGRDGDCKRCKRCKREEDKNYLADLASF